MSGGWVAKPEAHDDTHTAAVASVLSTVLEMLSFSRPLSGCFRILAATVESCRSRGPCGYAWSPSISSQVSHSASGKAGIANEHDGVLILRTSSTDGLVHEVAKGLLVERSRLPSFRDTSHSLNGLTNRAVVVTHDEGVDSTVSCYRIVWDRDGLFNHIDVGG